MKKIVVVGSINMDLVATVDRMPVAGETVTGTAFDTYGGGKGANQAVAVARLGGRVAMAGRLGRDGFGRQLRTQLVEYGVDATAVHEVDEPTGCAIITVEVGGANSIIVIPGANGAFDERELEVHTELLRGASVLLSQLEIPLETVVWLAGYAAENGIPFLLDPAPACELPPGLLRAVTWLTPNESEALSLLRWMGEIGDLCTITPQTAPLAAERLLASGVRNVILKMGSQGVYVCGKDIAPEFFPTFTVGVVDTTAAGDAWNGGFAYALAELNLAPAEAVRFACAVAAVSVTSKGAQVSMPLLSEVQTLLARARM